MGTRIGKSVGWHAVGKHGIAGQQRGLNDWAVDRRDVDDDIFEGKARQFQMKDGPRQTHDPERHCSRDIKGRAERVTVDEKDRAPCG